MGFIRNYCTGKITLRKVFWGGLFIGLVLSFPLAALKSSGIKKLVFLKIIIRSSFMLLWSVGLWQSAKNYSGNKIIKLLVQVYVIAIWIGILILLGFIFNRII